MFCLTNEEPENDDLGGPTCQAKSCGETDRVEDEVP